MDITAKIEFTQSDIEQLSSEIESKVKDEIIEEVSSEIENKIKDSIIEEIEDSFADTLTDRVRDSVLEAIDVSDDIDQWMYNNFDIESHLRDVDFSDYIDTDVENQAKNLLDNYNPSNGCYTGDAFTSAVERAVRYLCLKDDDFAEDIVRALDKAKKRINERKIIQEQKDYWIEMATPKIINDYNLQLQEYFKEVEIQKAKELLGSSVSEASIIPLNNLNNNIA